MQLKTPRPIPSKETWVLWEGSKEGGEGYSHIGDPGRRYLETDQPPIAASPPVLFAQDLIEILIAPSCSHFSHFWGSNSQVRPISTHFFLLCPCCTPGLREEDSGVSRNLPPTMVFTPTLPQGVVTWSKLGLCWTPGMWLSSSRMSWAGDRDAGPPVAVDW